MNAKRLAEIRARQAEGMPYVDVALSNDSYFPDWQAADQCARDRADLLADNEQLRAALKRELDACFCDDRDGNCNPPHNDECERCAHLRAALEGE